MFPGLSNMAGLMKQAKELQAKAAELKEGLRDLRVEATVGGGMVTVEASGDQRLISCRIEESLVQSGDREMIEDLVLSAANQALEKAREAAAGQMQQLAGGLDFPGLQDAMAKFGFKPE